MLSSLEIEHLIQEITGEVVGILNSECSSGNDCPSCNGDLQCANQRENDVDSLVKLGAARIGSGPGLANIRNDLAVLLDHTLLKADAVPKDIDKLCEEAITYNFASVCINPAYVQYAAKLVAGTQVKVCSVVGFPLGATTTAVKVYEAQMAEYDGAKEIDMVIHVGALKSKGYEYLENDIASIVKGVACDTIVKVIIETALLTDEEKVIACELAKKAGAHFVKTSTGFSSGGATAADVALMRRVVGETMGVKASGGIRDTKGAEMMVQAGANRIGASASVRIVQGDNS